MRKDILITDGVYHIYTKSIAGFKIFNNDTEFTRVIESICYYRQSNPTIRFARYIEDHNRHTEEYAKDKLIDIIAYCVMPTHLHLILKQLQHSGTSIFMSNVLNSYTRYFNIKHKRKGPLWEGRFKNATIKTDEQLLHLTRYIHLNPVTAYLVNKPEDWPYSSYSEYITDIKEGGRKCNYDKILDFDAAFYKNFVNNGIDYQRNLAHIKRLLLEATAYTS